MPQWLRRNRVLLILLGITAALLILAHLIVRALGLLPEEQRYVLAGAGVLAMIINYTVARRMHRSLTRVDLDKR